MSDPLVHPASAAGPVAPVANTDTLPASAAGSAAAPMLHWERALEAWMDHLDSEATRRAYTTTLRLLFTTPGMVNFIEDVTPGLLAAWRGALVRRTSLLPGSSERIAPATVNRHLAAARAFFSYWRTLGHVRLQLLAHAWARPLSH